MPATVGREVAQEKQVQKKISVFYGTQTGTAEQFASELVQKLKEQFDVSVDMTVRPNNPKVSWSEVNRIECLTGMSQGLRAVFWIPVVSANVQ